MALWIEEHHVGYDNGPEEEQGYLLGEPYQYETRFESGQEGELFRDAQREHGACVSKMYVDAPEGAKQIGWVFRKRRAYEDDPSKSYVHEVWITVLTGPDTVTRERHLAYFGEGS